MSTDEKRRNVIGRMVATAEVMGGTFSEAAAELLFEQIERYNEADIVAALKKVMSNRGRFTASMIIDQLASLDGRPTVDEAWAKIPRDESRSVAMTEEMCHAWGIAQPLLEVRDNFGARKAFEAAYITAVDAARADNAPVNWFPSLGDQASGRDECFAEVQRLNQEARNRLSGTTLRAIGNE